MSTTGWKDWLNYPPYGEDVVEVNRPEWVHPQLVKPSELHPSVNVDGLLWRPWKPH